MDARAAYDALFTKEGRANPYPFYASLHAHGQALDLSQPRPSATIHGYDAVHQLLRDPNFRVIDAERVDQTRPSWREHPALVVFMNSMMFSNDPTHGRLRRHVSWAFAPRRITALTDSIIRLVDELLDTIAAKGSAGEPVDFMAEFAYALPSNVIGALLGVPEEDRAWFRPHVIAIGGVLDGGDAGKLAAGDEAAAELMEYFARLVDARRKSPADDLVSALVQGWESDAALTETQLLATLTLLFNAGFETTTHLLGNGLSILLDNPDRMPELREDPSRASAFVDEFLRMEAPAQFTTRYAAEDAEVYGVTVPAGTTVLVMFGAANHDPSRFPKPGVFDPDRPANAALTFSAGPHFCPGAALTRLEGEIAFSRLVRRFPMITPAGASTRLDQLALRGFTHIPIRVG
ncbi:cytochrome P450 [Allorhizocola rhizosphaerae]|uniref:cytochrome P450 n=1 Tax=Allorhizocola rhizosphaerae TaxID=1872709 RepID=UPI000E3DCE6B|nr:cytochrome P450 [Allorhizocola rhizosphaerae]